MTTKAYNIHCSYNMQCPVQSIIFARKELLKKRRMLNKVYAVKKTHQTYNAARNIDMQFENQKPVLRNTKKLSEYISSVLPRIILLSASMLRVCECD